jgi:hypothetical protein
MELPWAEIGLRTAGVLERDPPHALGGEDAADDPLTLGVAAGDDDTRRVRDHPRARPR